jgi:branched-chain amino acid transport system ATP-binding protein
MMASALLSARSISKSFGGVQAVCNADIDVQDRSVHAIIGPNGAGKTTFISILSGELRSDEGVVQFLGQDVTGYSIVQRAREGMSRTFQITSVLGDMTVMENIIIALRAELPHSYQFFERTDSNVILIDEAQKLMDGAGLLDRRHTFANSLSHGERKELELAMSLAGRPRLLLLDEPMAGLGGVESGRFITKLASIKKSLGIVLIEHDMKAVFSLADTITVLDRGKVIAQGSPEQIGSDIQVRSAYLNVDE